MQFRKFTRIFILTVLMFLMASSIKFDLELFAQQATEEAFFYSDWKQVPLIIDLAQLGVVAREEVSKAEILEFFSRYEMKFVREYPGRIFFFALPQPMPREKLVELARRIQEEGAKLLSYTGYPATPLGAEVPLIVTDEFIALFKPEVAKDQIDSFNEEYGVRIIKPDPFVKNQFLLRVTNSSRLDSLDMANLYHKSDLTEFSHPNFVRVVILRQFFPSDPLFGNQWHHHNTGQGGGTVDADIDAPFAWDITQGSPNTIIAVIDDGFDIVHQDLTPNLWVNAGEIPGNGIDDDANGFIDDINGFDFDGNDGNPSPGAGDNHGTAVAGVAGAQGDNALGVTGSCPDCSLMLIRYGTTLNDDAQAFNYAQQMGAHVITNSWGYAIGTPATTVVENAINNAATNGRGGLGSIVLFAMNNIDQNDCAGANPDISAMANVIAVSASSNQDRKVTESAWGNCMDVLAPTHRGYGPNPNCWPAGSGVPYTGTLNIATTDRSGNAGYNNTNPSNNACGFDPTRCPGETANRDYTLCFGGTSAATPLTAGVAGLILSVDGTLTRNQVQQLLQDTADKIEDSAGSYAPNTGFSTPATGVATHGWGRVNAFEAVRIAAPVADDGKDGVDIFLRDNRLDWGNTEQPSNTLFEPTRGFIGHWRSMDIKVDAPPYQPAPTAMTFDAFTDETPSAASGDINRVYVRVRNRGPTTATSVTVKLHWTQFGTSLPPLPGDFWTAFPNDSTNTTQWHPLNCSGSTSTICTILNLAYSGSSVAGTVNDASQIAQFDFPAPPVDPLLANHFCLLAMIESTQDPISPDSKASFVVDNITPNDNNVTHRNYHNLDTSRSSRFVDRFFIRNPYESSIWTTLQLKAPKGWKIELDKFGFNKPFKLDPNEEVLATIQVSTPEFNAEGEITVFQEQIDPKKVMGGITYWFQPAKIPPAAPTAGFVSPYLTGTFDLRKDGWTILHIINPTAKNLRLLVVFLDDNERPLKCVYEKLSPNDLLELDVHKLGLKAGFGVVKVVSLNESQDVPEKGIVGYQRHFFAKGGATESVMQPISEDILQEDLRYIWEICKKY